MLKHETVDALFSLIARLLLLISILLLATLVSINALEIALRTFFDTSLSWILETNIAIASSMYFLGAAVVYHEGRDISSTFIVDTLPTKIRSGYLRLITIVSGLVYLAAAWFAWKLILLQYPFSTPGVGFPRIIYTVPLLVAFLVISLECVWRGIHPPRATVDPVGTA